MKKKKKKKRKERVRTKKNRKQNAVTKRGRGEIENKRYFLLLYTAKKRGEFLNPHLQKKKKL